ncbi:MAG: gliding motility protein GldC [Flavobacteriia bacterium]|nr:gliding motility protein GldC [Flavobacteriia bacterium]OIP48132.1 MAG: gliding motility protein GldC [Flavobacteriaceae bacterium CG2_30_31_66]PIV97838.1 MAG: gliding motility protein GldC [Flavobacteriaceae bacterium CG17_big_fil_post_rev_8_21_14_2_50_31_13]PIX11059.1 MAG: gliding motility protein GldC [Flavobacteriaceae bacterium CG_4_8_14_3_um_filter_31_8]PIY14579.1 MAG: gliding motility protein GldC [Flavobacteriaceae bacterium CG_4_10_14_3_um_filter_31_253]PIZ10846.1 MAG: gliding moti
MAIFHNTEVNFKIALDENKIPDNISWTAKDGGIENQPSKAVMISVWDHQKKDTLRMDLWTKDMPVDEMKQFYHQTLVSMADSYERATNDRIMSETMRDFCEYFAENLKIKKGN